MLSNLFNKFNLNLKLPDEETQISAGDKNYLIIIYNYLD